MTVTLRADTPPVWPFLFIIASIVYGLLRKQGRGKRPDPPVFTLRRALVARVHGVPHYFVEVDDDGLRRESVIHLAGKRLTLLEPDPATERGRTFPSSRFIVHPSEEVLESGRGSFTIDCLGTTVDPLVAKDASWLERIGDSLLGAGAEECDKPFESYMRLCGCEVDAAQATRSFEWTAPTPARGDWRLRAVRALRVDERGRRGPHYYMELADGTVLHLNGFGLRPLEPSEEGPRVFPCDTLEPLYPPKSCLEWPEGVNCLGTAFEPDEGGRPIGHADRNHGWVPRDWGRLDKPYAEILAHFDGRSARRMHAAPPTSAANAPTEPLQYLAPVHVNDERRVTPKPSPSHRFSALRALRVEERGSRGPHYFALLKDGKVLHLNGRHLLSYEPDRERERLFPCSTFESMDGCPNILCLGEPFEPEVAGRAVSFTDRYNGFVTDNWMLVDKSYEEIRDHFAVEPATPKDPSSGRPASVD